MSQYRCYLFDRDKAITDVKEFTAVFDVKAVLLARETAARAGYSGFELRHDERIVRRESGNAIGLGGGIAS